jgi:hypothetical protein
MWLQSATRNEAARSVRTVVPADSLAKLRIFVVAPAAAEQRSAFAFAVQSSDGAESDGVDASFERPGDLR